MLDFEEHGDKCLLYEISWIQIALILSGIYLLISLIEIISQSDIIYGIIIGESYNLMGLDIIMLILEIIIFANIISLAILIPLPTFIFVTKRYLPRGIKIKYAEALAYIIGFSFGIILNSLLAEVIFGYLVNSIITFISVIFALSLHTILNRFIREIGITAGLIYGGFIGTLLILLLKSANKIFLSAMLGAYISTFLLLLLLYISIDRFWKNFAIKYIKPRGMITYKEIEEKFSIKLDRESGLYLARIFENVGLKVKNRYKGNEVVEFVVKA